MYALMMKTDKMIEGGYPTVVNYNISLDRLLKSGRYDYVMPEITAENFPSQGKGKERIVATIIRVKNRPIFFEPCFDRELFLIEKKGFEVVNLQELLTVFNQHGNIKAETAVLALGSSVEFNDRKMAPQIRECIRGTCVGLEEI